MEPTTQLCRSYATVAVLFVALLSAAMYAHSQARRAADAEAALRAVANAAPRITAAPSAGRYPITLIKDDGSRTALDGKALHVDFGGGRLLEVELRRQPTGHLRMWAPAKRDDGHINVLVFHPYCANVFALELERHSTRVAAAEGAVIRTSPE